MKRTPLMLSVGLGVSLVGLVLIVAAGGLGTVDTAGMVVAGVGLVTAVLSVIHSVLTRKQVGDSL